MSFVSKRFFLLFARPLSKHRLVNISFSCNQLSRPQIFRKFTWWYIQPCVCGLDATGKQNGCNEKVGEPGNICVLRLFCMIVAIYRQLTFCKTLHSSPNENSFTERIVSILDTSVRAIVFLCKKHCDWTISRHPPPSHKKISNTNISVLNLDFKKVYVRNHS